jgi:hypothetical protein
MILQGQETLAQNSVAMEAKAVAAEALENGSDAWNQAQIDKERFLIMDILNDIKFGKNKEEQIISAIHLFEPLLQFCFRGQAKWATSGKSLMRLFKTENPEITEEWTGAFKALVETGDAMAVETVVTKILGPHGGFLWDGFRSEVRKNVKELDILIAENFYEIGASGKIYDKKNILLHLPLEQNNDPVGKIIDFEIYQISENLIRAHYNLEEKTRRTMRTSIWKRQHNNYQMIFHQGTKCEVGNEHE